MNRFFTISLAAVLALVGCTTSNDTDSSSRNEVAPVAIEVFNSLRIPAHRVKISLDTTGKLKLETQDKGGKPRSSSIAISAVDMIEIQTILQRIDWDTVLEDEVLGLDGTSVRVAYRGEEYSVWTPSHDTAKRRLKDFLRLKNELFGLAGLGESGLPR